MYVQFAGLVGHVHCLALVRLFLISEKCYALKFSYVLPQSAVEFATLTQFNASLTGATY